MKKSFENSSIACLAHFPAAKRNSSVANGMAGRDVNVAQCEQIVPFYARNSNYGDISSSRSGPELNIIKNVKQIEIKKRKAKNNP